ncbi:MAG: hypothetical protein KGM60_07525 [Comamonadaceae bacterium]|nr:hypothetical protein [Comamonadaceae bacterium]
MGGVGYGVYNTATGLADSDYTKAGLGAADTAASASLVTPAAPIGATWLGARAAHDVLQGAADKFDLGDTIGGTINQIGLRTGLWGTDDSAYLQQKAQSAAPAPTNLRDPAITGPSVVRPSDAFAGPDVRYAGADYQPPTAQPPANPNAPTNDVTKTVGPDGRVSYSGGNVGGNITINGSGQLGGGSISPQNMAAADALVGRQAQQSAQRAMADMPMAQAPTVLHSGNDWASRNALRNLEVTASSAMNYSERCSSRETYRI